MEEVPQMPFSTIKDKIIKTDDVINCYLKIDNEYKKCKKHNKFLKTVYEQLKMERNRLTLDNERLSFSCNTMQNKLSTAEKENQELRQQIFELESQYNKRINEHQGHLKELKLQLDQQRKKLSLIERSEKRKDNQIKKLSNIAESSEKYKSLQNEQIVNANNSKNEKDQLLLSNNLERVESITDISSLSTDIADVEDECPEIFHSMPLNMEKHDDISDNRIEDIMKEMTRHPQLLSPLNCDHSFIHKPTQSHMFQKSMKSRSSLKNEQFKAKKGHDKFRSHLKNGTLHYYRQIINVFSQRRHFIKNKFKWRNNKRNKTSKRQNNMQKSQKYENEQRKDTFLFEDGVIIAAMKKLKELNLNFAITTNSINQSPTDCRNSHFEMYLNQNYRIDKLLSLRTNIQTCSLVVERSSTKNEHAFVGFISSNNIMKNCIYNNFMVNNTLGSLISTIRRKRKNRLQEILTIDGEGIKQISNCKNRIDGNAGTNVARISPQRRTNQKCYEEFSNNFSAQDLSKFPKKRKMICINDCNTDFLSDNSSIKEMQHCQDNLLRVREPKLCDMKMNTLLKNNENSKAKILQNVTILPQQKYIKFTMKSCEKDFSNHSINIIPNCTANVLVSGKLDSTIRSKSCDEKTKKECFSISKMVNFNPISPNEMLITSKSVEDEIKLNLKQTPNSSVVNENYLDNCIFNEISNKSELSLKELNKSNCFSNLLKTSNCHFVNNLEQRQLENTTEYKLSFVENLTENKNCTESNTLYNDKINNKICVKKAKRHKVKEVKQTRINMLWNRLLTYSNEEEIVNEIVTEFKAHNPTFLCKNILNRISNDIFDKPSKKHNSFPIPMLTETQRICIGLLIKLDNENGSRNFVDTYIQLTEKELLTTRKLQIIAPLSKMYAALCKLTKNIDRIRMFCLEALYFMTDLVVPMLFTLLTTWIEVFPKYDESKGNTLLKVFVQIIHKKSCNESGYNLLTLKKLLFGYYGYQNEMLKNDELFDELLNNYLHYPSNSTITALILFMKHETSEWVFQKMNSAFIPLYYKINNKNFKKTILLLFGYVCRQIKGVNEMEIKGLNDLKKWMSSVLTEEPVHILRKQACEK